MWNTVFAALRPGATADAVALDAAEAALGLALPPSYRRFAETCGAGLIGGSVRLYLPSPEAERDLVAQAHVISHSIAVALDSLAAARSGDEPHRFTVEGDADAALMERACFFGRTEAGGFVFWDVSREEPADRLGEYDVWVLAPDLETVRFGGTDLPAFVRALQGEEAARVLGPGAAALPSAFEGDAHRQIERREIEHQEVERQDSAVSPGTPDTDASGVGKPGGEPA